MCVCVCVCVFANTLIYVVSIASTIHRYKINEELHNNNYHDYSRPIELQHTPQHHPIPWLFLTFIHYLVIFHTIELIFSSTVHVIC